VSAGREVQRSNSSPGSPRTEAPDAERVRLNGEIDLLMLINIAWSRRWLVLASTFLATVAAWAYVWWTVPVYTAQLALIPAQDSDMPAPRSLGGLASIASIAGLGLPADRGGISFLLYKEGVASRAVAEVLSRQQEVMRTIFSGEWDEKGQCFSKPRRGFIRAAASGVKSLLGYRTREWREPDAVRLQEYIRKHVRVGEDAEQPILRLTYQHEDPAFAADLLMRVHAALDEELRERARRRAAAHIEHLSGQLQQARVVEHRNAIAQSLSEQEKTLMMASSALAFAAEPVDTVQVSPAPTHPRPLPILMLGIASGFGIGLALALIRAIRSGGRGMLPGERRL
jgi:uncharacterized protein involved in exopolysaccharide biosynthesis